MCVCVCAHTDNIEIKSHNYGWSADMWFHNLGAYVHGFPCRIYLVGQSAGAHIAACALLNQAIKEGGEGENTSWSVSQIKAYFGISGG